MSKTVKLSGKLAKDDEFNGLDAQVDDLIAEPQTVWVGFVYYDVGDIHIKPDDDTEVPTVRIRRFEPIGKAEEVSGELQKLVQQAVEDRTGKKPLPFGQVDGIEVDE